MILHKTWKKNKNFTISMNNDHDQIEFNTWLNHLSNMIKWSNIHLSDSIKLLSDFELWIVPH